MAGKDKGKFDGTQCPACLQGTLRDGTRAETVEYRGRAYRYTAKGAFCDHCDDGVTYHDAKEEAAWQAFRARVDAEEAAELRRIRRKLRLTQHEAAKITGGGHNAFSRYERGKAQPVEAVVNLFRLLDRHPDLLREVRGVAQKS